MMVEMFCARGERAAASFSKSARRQFIHDSVMEMYCAGCGCGLWSLGLRDVWLDDDGGLLLFIIISFTLMSQLN